MVITPLQSFPLAALRVRFERDSYSVREDAGSLLYRVIANSTASFDYQVVITGVDGSATCKLIGYPDYVPLIGLPYSVSAMYLLLSWHQVVVELLFCVS